MPLSLLFIEDNEDILLNLYTWFENYICDSARNGNAGFQFALEGSYDCIVLDIMLPGMDGLELCEKLRAAGNVTPIIMLTARDTLEDKIKGLECGADDYLVKPFSLKELEARIKAVLRRGASLTEKNHFGTLTLDSVRHAASREGVELRLSPSCFRILQALMEAAPGVVRKEALEKMLYGDEAPEGSALRNHIHELRKVVDKPFSDPLLETVPHIGWRLKCVQD